MRSLIVSGRSAIVMTSATVIVVSILFKPDAAKVYADYGNPYAKMAHKTVRIISKPYYWSSETADAVSDFDGTNLTMTMGGTGYESSTVPVYTWAYSRKGMRGRAWARPYYSGGRCWFVEMGRTYVKPNTCDTGDNKIIRAEIEYNTYVLGSDEDYCSYPSDTKRWLIRHEMMHVLGFPHVDGCSPSSTLREYASLCGGYPWLVILTSTDRNYINLHYPLN